MFQAEEARDGCAKWIDSLIKDKEMEIWNNVTEDLDLPKVNVNEDRMMSPTLLL